MSGHCIAIHGDHLGATLAGVDCRLQALVRIGYGHLFAAGGTFQTVLTALLIIYVAILAYGLMFGRLSVSIGAMAPKLVAIGLVLTFATSWPSYQAVIFNVLTRGPDQIVSAFAGKQEGETQTFVNRLDKMLDRMQDAANALEPSGHAAGTNPGKALQSQASTAALIVRASAFLLVLGTFGILIIARILLTVLLAVGPVFIVLALFEATRGLFEGWLRASAMFALTPLIIVLSGAVGLRMLAPMITAIGDPMLARQSLEPAGALLAAALIDFALTLVCLLGAAMLVRGWRIGGSGRMPESRQAPDRSDVHAPLAAGPAVVQVSEPSYGDDRIGAIIGAVLRETVPAFATAAPVRVDVAPLPVPASAGRDRRLAGLGRTARLAPATRKARKP